MYDTDISSLEHIMKSPIDIPMDLNDVRIIVECLRAITYFGEIEGEEYLDSEGQALKDRIERFYQEKIAYRPTTDSGSSSRAFQPLQP